VSSHYLSKICPKSPVLTDKGLYLTCYYIPLASEKKIILAQAHNKFMHNGRDKMLIMIRRIGFTWWNLTNDVNTFIKDCKSCKFKNIKKTKVSPTTTQIISTHPRHIYQIDLVLLAQIIKIKTLNT